MNNEERLEYYNNLVLLKKEKERVKKENEALFKLEIELARRNTELFTRQFQTKKQNNSSN